MKCGINGFILLSNRQLRRIVSGSKLDIAFSTISMEAKLRRRPRRGYLSSGYRRVSISQRVVGISVTIVAISSDRIIKKNTGTSTLRVYSLQIGKDTAVNQGLLTGKVKVADGKRETLIADHIFYTTISIVEEGGWTPCTTTE
nr:uncharacterized protein LOC116652379 [Drosophila virilis]